MQLLSEEGLRNEETMLAEQPSKALHAGKVGMATVRNAGLR